MPPVTSMITMLRSSQVRDDAALGAAYFQPGQTLARAQVLDRYDLSIYAQPEAGWLGKRLDTVARRAPAQALPRRRRPERIDKVEPLARAQGAAAHAAAASGRPKAHG